MAELDPKLQRELAEYVAHKNEQIRFGRKYGLWIALAMLAVFIGGGFLLQWKSKRDHDRDVQEMNEEHEQRVKEMRERQEQWRQQHLPPQQPMPYAPGR